MVAISGFTLVRNACRLDFPVVASIRSLLPVCDEVVVNVGHSEDDTLGLIRSIADPKVRILETRWGQTPGTHALADATQQAMRACRHRWGIYIQADEVLHEDGAAELAATIQAVDADPQVEGLLVRYLHFYGSPRMIAQNRRWYRREVRAVRLDPALDVRSFSDAQGFRVGPEHRKIRARLTDALMYHYGWARPPAALIAKREVDRELYSSQGRADPHRPLLPWSPGIRPFLGRHPAAAQDWVQQRDVDARPLIGPKVFKAEHLRMLLSDAVERVTGARLFEFRNYRLV